MARNIVENNKRIFLMKEIPRKIQNKQGGLDHKVYLWCWENSIRYKKVYIKAKNYDESDTVLINKAKNYDESDTVFIYVCKGIEFNSIDNILAFKLTWC